MKARAMVLSLAVTMLCSVTQAVDFPLQVKQVSLEDARMLPGNYGRGASLSYRVPAQLRNAPKLVSAKPMYAQFGTVMRLGESRSSLRWEPIAIFDESRGTGTGYDRLYFDLNGNGDLKSAPAITRIKEKKQDASSITFNYNDFGPIKLPSSKTIGQYQPSFYAQMYTYTYKASSSSLVRSDPNRVNGYARIWAAQYLETTVELNGVKQKFGLLDGNCNFQIGDLAGLNKYNYSGTPPEIRWMLAPADVFLRDQDNSGEFKNTIGSRDSESYSRLVYFGGKPYTITLSADYRQVQFNSCTQPMGTLNLPPEVSQVVLGMEKGSETWEIATPGLVNQRAIIPAGTYRIASATLRGDAGSGKTLITETTSGLTEVQSVTAGGNANLKIGLPLRLNLTTSNAKSIVPLEREAKVAVPSTSTLRLNLAILGVAGEKYGSFTQIDSQGKTERPKPPTYEIIGPDGKQIAAGDFEFG
jgi:hypothetical protein